MQQYTAVLFTREADTRKPDTREGCPYMSCRNVGRGNVGVTLAVTRFAVSWLLSFQIPLLPLFLVCLRERFLVKIAHTDIDGLFLDQEQ